MELPLNSDLVLASASPQRLKLLAQLGLSPEIMPADVDETPLPSELPSDYVKRLALAKAEKVFRQCEEDGRASVAVLGADTTVVCADTILGKPADREDGLAMLSMLSGSTHSVLTGAAIVSKQGFDSCVTVTEVDFIVIDPITAERYWGSGEPVGKAGGYAVQGKGAAFVSELRGSYSNVVGLPLCETAKLLERAGINIF